MIEVSDLSILLVEPSTSQNKAIVKQLMQAGITRIETTSTGSETLLLLDKYIPDLIISSMYLADMTATELITKIRETDTFDSLPFMLVSSATKFSELNPIRQAGVVAILPKPFNHDDLKRALQTTLEYIDPEEIHLEHYDIESLRVLIVDDSALARKHITKTLNNMGIRLITTACDGHDAIDKFKIAGESFDLLVTDYNMPEMDGRELIEYIRSELNNTFIPILMVTSENNEARLNNIQQAGVSAICDKPFDPEHVKEILFKILEG